MGNTSSHIDELSRRVNAIKLTLIDRRYNDALQQATTIINQYVSEEIDSDISKNISRSLLFRARANAALGKSQAAITDVNSAFRYIDQKNSANNVLLAQLYLARGDAAFDLEQFQQAYDDCKKAEGFAPDNVDIAKTLSKLYYQHQNQFHGEHTSDSSENTKQKAYTLAEELLTKMITNNPASASLKRTRALARIEADNFDGAYEDIIMAINLDPEYSSSYLIKADIEFEKKDYNAAIKNCNFAISKHLNIRDDIERGRVLAEIHCLLAEAHLALGQLEPAGENAKAGLKFCFNPQGKLYVELSQLCADLNVQIIQAQTNTACDEYFSGHMQARWQCLVTGARSVSSELSEPTTDKSVGCWIKLCSCFGKTADTVAIALPAVALVSIIISIINERIENYGKDKTKETCDNIVLWFAKSDADADQFCENYLIDNHRLNQYRQQVRAIMNNSGSNQETKDRAMVSLCNDILNKIIAEKMCERIEEQLSIVVSPP